MGIALLNNELYFWILKLQKMKTYLKVFTLFTLLFINGLV
jgi:hypothetical protein